MSFYRPLSFRDRVPIDPYQKPDRVYINPYPKPDRPLPKRPLMKKHDNDDGNGTLPNDACDKMWSSKAPPQNVKFT